MNQSSNPNNLHNLFGQSPNPPLPPELERLRMLDLPDSDPQKQAFLKQEQENGSDDLPWQQLEQLVQAGRNLPQIEPDDKALAPILAAAREEQRDAPHAQPTPPQGGFFSGWRWAWAAVFVAISWGAYIEMQPETQTPVNTQQLESELQSLEQELDVMMSNLGQELSGSI